MNRRSFLVSGAGAAELVASSDVLEYLAPSADAGQPGPKDSHKPEALLHARKEGAYVRAESQGKTVRWSIGNGLVERLIKFSPSHGLYTEKLENAISHTNFVKAPSSSSRQTPPVFGVQFLVLSPTLTSLLLT